jgi:nicotinamidase-related amidase
MSAAAATGDGVSAGRLQANRTTLVVIDVQEAFRKAVPGFAEVARAAATLVRGAEAMGVPIIVTEQYPKGLGRTAPEIADVLPEGIAPIEKVCFSAPRAEGFDLAGRDQALVCGIETHVCVNQTALDLLAEGVEVQVALDAVDSRSEQNKEIGIERMERAGAVVTSVETALFELLGRAGTEEFKRVQQLILEYAPNPA